MARPRVEQRLDEVKPGGVGLVVAPAGAGKSVAMAQWTDARAEPTGWLDVTPAHNDPIVFARALVRVIHDACDAFDPSVGALVSHDGSSVGRSFCDAVVGELASLPSDLVLVLDDAHHLSGRALVDDLTALFLALPPNVRGLVGSRWDPAFAAGRLWLTEPVGLRAAELAFDQAEAAELLEAVAGHAITAEQAGLLVDRTDGWAVGLQLAAISMQRTPDVQRFVETFAGDNRMVADYLTAEVLRHQDADTGQFLLQTSILEWLTPELCDAVTEQSNGAAMLDDLERRSIFVVPVDGSDPDRRRYHHLFADLLRYHLRLGDPRVEALLRGRAADWLAAHDELPAAIDQRMAARDWVGAFDLVRTRGHTIFERGESVTLVGWLERLRQELPRPAVSVNLLAAQIGADRFTEAEETYRMLTRDADLEMGERAASETLRSMGASSDLPTGEVRRSAQAVIDALPLLDDGSTVDFLGIGGKASMEAVAHFAFALADFWDADVVAAARRFRSTLDLPGAAYPVWRINALGGLALAQVWLGHVDESRRLAATAIRTADEHGIPHHRSVTLARLAMAAADLERLDLAGAGLHLEEAAQRLERSRRVPYLNLHHVLSARHAELTGGAEVALSALRDEVPGELERPVLADARRTHEARMLLGVGATTEAHELLARCHRPAPAEQIDLFLATDRPADAREVLQAWTHDEADVRASVMKDLRAAVLADRQGHAGRAGSLLGDALQRAEVEELRLPFVTCPAAIAILQRSTPRRRGAFHDSILDAFSPPRRAAANESLIEPLSDRECRVIEYLPTRLSNQEIAESLYISVNTLKTHLRNIYRKLAVNDRDAATAEATRLGLL